ncbi:hypothetical protein [Nonomuraea sp. bgisy101]|uniref:hypothetical protein n=1 Tax=Nonomuraea sp. bgisy101 TaxID=3413784 RepID=UPI003D7549BC
MTDDVHRYNKDRWEALAEANALFTRPRLDLDAVTARAYPGLDRLAITYRPDLVGVLT